MHLYHYAGGINRQSHGADKQTGMGWMTAADLGSPGYTGDLNNRCITIAQVLQSAGYATYMSGKWHVTADRYYEDPENVFKHNWPLQRGFDKYFGSLAGGGSYYHPKALVSGNDFIKVPQKFYYSDAINDTAIAYLEKHDPGKPFFLFVSHFAPHYPLHAQPEKIEEHIGKYLVGWDSIRSYRLERMKVLDLVPKEMKLSERDANVPAWEDIPDDEHEQWDKRMAIYAAQVVDIDNGLGSILALLKKQDKLENTFILFLSDNGACDESPSWQPQYMGTDSSFTAYEEPWANASNTPFNKYKKWSHEGGIATPMIVHWPAKEIQKGAITHQLGHVIDLMPTFLEAAGVTYPSVDTLHTLPGKSLINSFSGKITEREPLYWEHEANRGIRKGKWKLVSEGNHTPPYTGDWELYDIEKDRIESNNLASKYPE